jgi:membrane protease YdiL (CAAX protease family)
LLAVAFDRPVVHDFMRDAYTTADPLWLLWLAVVVAAPAFEEIFYRGFLYYGLAGSRLGVTGATVISALAFASIHIQYELFEITVVFAMGILLAIARQRTGSILVPIGMHALNNFVATVETAMAVVR